MDSASARIGGRGWTSTVMRSPPRRRCEPFAGPAVDENESGFDQFLDAGAAELGAVGGDDAIEPLAGFVSGDDEFVTVAQRLLEFAVKSTRRFALTELRLVALAGLLVGDFGGVVFVRRRGRRE